MKFGRTFAAARHPTWRCVDYDALKSLLKRGVSVRTFAAKLYDEVVATDEHFEMLRQRSEDGEAGVEAEALQSHAVLNYLAVLKIQKKAIRFLPGGEAALREEDGWADLLSSSFCQALCGSSLFVETARVRQGVMSPDGDFGGFNADDDHQGCPVCLLAVALAPLQCGHRACASCLVHCASVGLSRCPLCRAPSTLDPACALIESLLGVPPSDAAKYAPFARLPGASPMATPAPTSASRAKIADAELPKTPFTGWAEVAQLGAPPPAAFAFAHHATCLCTEMCACDMEM
jgi:hypothetical protein